MALSNNSSIIRSVLKGFYKDFKFIGRAILVIFLTIVLIYIAICGYIYRFQEKIIFRPPKVEPQTFELPGYVKTPLSIEEGKDVQHGLYFENPNSEKLTIFLYGNASEMHQLSDRLTWLSSFVDSSIFVFNYPGYGENTGKPSEQEIYRWIGPWMKLIQEKYQHSPDQILIWGHSLGGGVATEMATRYDIHSLIIDGTFSSIVDVARKKYPLFPVDWLCRNRFENDQKLPKLKCPILVIHSKDDDVIAYKEFEKIKALLENDPKNHFLSIKGSHRDAIQNSSSDVIDAFNKFLPEWSKTSQIKIK